MLKFRYNVIFSKVHCQLWPRKIYFSRNKISTSSSILIEKKDVSAETLPKAFKPNEIENGWYEWWESKGYFKPKTNAKPFSLLLPPPNVTGTLHLGHALTGTIQDVIIRWRRMKGESVLWIPGVDHAGIATQVVVEKYLFKEFKKKKNDLGREKFVSEVWKWKNEKGDKIVEQLRGLGLSLDWSRLVFTMDPLPSEAVNAAFIHLFETGAIYRADALVNWSCALESSISDVEVEMKEVSGPTLLNLPNCPEPVEFGVLTEIAYRVYNEDTEVVVATTRPETMLGDTAVALHPDDPRRSKLEGKSVWHPFRNLRIPIIFDPFVDQTLGTAAVKITPAHDSVDWEIGKKHKLETVPVFNEKGFVTSSKFKGKHRLEARKLVIEHLKNIGLYRGAKNHTMQIPMCSRSGDVVELMLKPQWFINCKVAAAIAAEAVKNGQLILEPENYKNVWFNWLENIKDWNISRQLWWGHQIPAYEVSPRDGQKKIWVGAASLEEAKRKGAAQLGVSDNDLEVLPDPDVFDTWFSSALFPLYCLGWPNCGTEFLQRFPYPILETGNDIIFFWVARMTMMSILLTGRVPFEKVLLHGVVCDAQGRKMSKSLGNVVVPEDIVHGATLEQLAESVHEAHRRGLLSDAEVQTSLKGQKKLFPDGIPDCGVDALRLTLCSQAIQNDSISFDVPTCHTNKLFCNKILQAFKFMMLALGNETVTPKFSLNSGDMSSFDRWIINRLSATVAEVNKSLDTFQFHAAVQSLKQFLYGDLCNVYLEAIKPVLRNDDESSRLASLSCLYNCFDTSLRLLHPFMPYITEELYQRLPTLPGYSSTESIMIAPYPDYETWSAWRNIEIDEIVAKVMIVASSVRKIKALFGTKGEKPEVIVVTKDSNLSYFLNSNLVAVKSLSKASIFTVHTDINEELVADYFKEVLDDSSTVFVHVSNENKVRIGRLEPTLKREQKIRLQLEKLKSLLEDGQRQTSPESRACSMNKIKALQLQLDKILDIKKLLQEKR